jgi:hypothetical protein
LPFSPESYETEESSFENKDLVFFFQPVVCFFITHLRLQRSQVFAFSRMVYYLSRVLLEATGVLLQHTGAQWHTSKTNK